MERFKSVEEAHIKMNMTCKHCNAARAQVPDLENPVKYCPQGIDGSGKCFTIAYGSKDHPSHLCYYHLKEHMGYFSCPTLLQVMRADYIDKRGIYKLTQERRKVDMEVNYGKELR